MSAIAKKFHLTAFQRSLLIGICVCITSQLYFSGWAEGFRLSFSAIFFPVLLLSLKRESHHPDAGLMTALCVIVFRVAGDLLGGAELTAALMTEYPGGVFYLCYDGLFCLMVKAGLFR